MSKKTHKIKIENSLAKPQEKPELAKNWLKMGLPNGLSYTVILLFSILIYIQTISYDYTVDDAIVLYDNQFVKKGFEGIKDIFTHDTFVGFFGKDNKALVGGRYRPFSVALFAVEYEIFGAKPAFSHLINVLLYAGTGILLFLTLFRILKNYSPLIPFISTLLFIAHPLHTEAVTNIKGRDEILCLLFLLVSIKSIFEYHYLKKIIYLLIYLIFFFFAILSKENAITFLAVIPLLFYFFSEAKIKNIVLYTGLLLIPTAIFLFLRNEYAGGAGSQPVTEILNNFFVNATTSQKFATITLILGKYLGLLIVPHPLVYDYSFNQIPYANWTDLLVILSLSFHIFLGVYCIIKFKQKDFISFCILYYFITLSIVTNIFFPIGAPMSERFLYQPSLGFCLLLSFILVRYLGPKTEVKSTGLLFYKKLSYVVLYIVLAYSFRTIFRNPAWKDNFTLFKNDMQYCPNSAKALNALGGELVTQANKISDENIKKEMFKEAFTHLSRAVEIHPSYTNAWLLLGNAEFGLNKKALEAVKYYDKAIQNNPTFKDAFYNAGYLLINQEQSELAIKYFCKLLSFEPGHLDANYYTGLAYKNISKPDSALYYFNRTLALSPLHYRACQKIGLIYGENNNIPQAIVFLKKAIELNRTDTEPYINLGIAYAKSGNANEALLTFTEGIKIDPKNAELYFNMGITYQSLGNVDEARKNFEKAFDLNPKLRK